MHTELVIQDAKFICAHVCSSDTKYKQINHIIRMQGLHYNVYYFLKLNLTHTHLCPNMLVQKKMSLILCIIIGV